MDHDDWIGRTSRREDVIAARALAEFRATLDGFLGPGEVPPGFHWTLAPELSVARDLGRDGHPRTGLFLPNLMLPRRMWAGGALEFPGELSPGDRVTRDTTIADITLKTGASGRLGFVTVRHDWSVGGSPRIVERQDIVYREDPRPGAAPPDPRRPEPWDALAVWRPVTDATLLFRFSAMTFNGHRVHYDRPYATGVEGYGGLVVHGPLQAVWMLNLAATLLGRLPRAFRYRALSPLICGEDVAVEARSSDAGVELRVLNGAGVATMSGLAET
jgi:3-methylfumaryl-CoA hydratase